MSNAGKKKEKYAGPKGPCTDCGTKESPFTPVRSHTSTGKSRMVQLCDKCKPVMK